VRIAGFGKIDVVFGFESETKKSDGEKITIDKRKRIEKKDKKK
jgi:hypothetical protein